MYVIKYVYVTEKWWKSFRTLPWDAIRHYMPMGNPWWERQHKKLREPHDNLGLGLQVKNSPWIYLDLPSLVCFQSSSTKWFKIAWETARRYDNLKEPDRLSGEREKREKGSRSISKEGPLAFSSPLTRKIVGNGAGTSINWWSFYWHIYDVSVRCRNIPEP